MSEIKQTVKSNWHKEDIQFNDSNAITNGVLSKAKLPPIEEGPIKTNLDLV